MIMFMNRAILTVPIIRVDRDSQVSDLYIKWIPFTPFKYQYDTTFALEKRAEQRVFIRWMNKQQPPVR